MKLNSRVLVIGWLLDGYWMVIAENAQARMIRFEIIN
ncbi:MAG: hypothetical protein ACJAQ4_002540 [Cryomorphaceae bacterium]|jgi:hypothetical protein